LPHAARVCVCVHVLMALCHMLYVYIGALQL